MKNSVILALALAGCQVLAAPAWGTYRKREDEPTTPAAAATGNPASGDDAPSVIISISTLTIYTTGLPPSATASSAFSAPTVNESLPENVKSLQKILIKEITIANEIGFTPDDDKKYPDANVKDEGDAKKAIEDVQEIIWSLDLKKKCPKQEENKD
ncbi:hypothetical protein P154DRAFT_597985 [Amniculicola lignicola CBS 123094]|uniref:Uncharacterized protein n=1 Tax=Amniculicola lignicola CBS 123094 TaxID=1392246 RepID=A0A6A5WGW4_9PLEO|nr:hypothetical protein P154DRAFT_597985 [Amniculicola lignicola CBS 123094]